MYYVKNEYGILICELSTRTGKILILDTKGRFEDRKFKDGKIIYSYVLEEDIVYTLYHPGYESRIFFWKGYYLYEN